MRRHAHGFTLFEVLIALAIIAVAMSAVSRATLMATDATTDFRNRQFALWVAENRYAWHRAVKDWPPLGTAKGIDVQGGVPFLWVEEVNPTPNGGIRRVDISVRIDDASDYALARLVVFLAAE